MTLPYHCLQTIWKWAHSLLEKKITASWPSEFPLRHLNLCLKRPSPHEQNQSSLHFPSPHRWEGLRVTQCPFLPLLQLNQNAQGKAPFKYPRWEGNMPLTLWAHILLKVVHWHTDRLHIEKCLHRTQSRCSESRRSWEKFECKHLWNVGSSHRSRVTVEGRRRG